MRLYEIDGFDKGVKVRRKVWADDMYIWFYHNDGRYSLQKSHKDLNCHNIELLMYPDWRVYQEPKITKLDKGDILDGLDIEIDVLDTSLMNLRAIREAINLDTKE